jgi:hypothetical protein
MKPTKRQDSYCESYREQDRMPVNGAGAEQTKPLSRPDEAGSQNGRPKARGASGRKASRRNMDHRLLRNLRLVSGRLSATLLFTLFNIARFAGANGTGLVMQDDTQQGAVHLKVTVVLDEPQAAKLVHEETDT